MISVLDRGAVVTIPENGPVSIGRALVFPSFCDLVSFPVPVPLVKGLVATELGVLVRAPVSTEVGANVEEMPKICSVPVGRELGTNTVELLVPPSRLPLDVGTISDLLPVPFKAEVSCETLEAFLFDVCDL